MRGRGVDASLGANGNKVSDGWYYVRFRTQGFGRRDWRRQVLVRRGGRFFAARERDGEGKECDLRTASYEPRG